MSARKQTILTIKKPYTALVVQAELWFIINNFIYPIADEKKVLHIPRSMFVTKRPLKDPEAYLDKPTSSKTERKFSTSFQL